MHIKAELEQFGPTASPYLRDSIGISLWRDGVRGEKVLQMIMSGLSDDDASIQERALGTISDLHISNREVTTHLLRLLKSANADLRRAVVTLLKKSARTMCSRTCFGK